MTAPQYFPIPAELETLALETIQKRVGALPVIQDGVSVTGALITTAMECLNAEFNKTLPVKSDPLGPGNESEGLDRCLERRLGSGAGACTTPVIDVLIRAGIAEPAEVLDKVRHTRRKGIRLVPSWTWHIASGPILAGDTNDSPFSWMSLCPICRAGVLTKVLGKQLYGIPRTDYIIECSSCGAKMIPVGDQFRLVSIAAIRDPLWKSFLDKTFAPDAWAAIAHKTSTGDSRRVPARPSVKSPAPAHAAPVQRLTGTSVSRLKDGSVAIPCESRIIYFKPVLLKHSGGIKNELFIKSQKTLQDLIDTPPYADIRDTVMDRYARYLSMKIGLVLSQLKARHDMFYLEFLNRWGDERYGTFMIEECAEADRSGVYLIVTEGKVYESGVCTTTFRRLVNQELGRVTPEACYRDHDGKRCRLNSLLSTGKSTSGLFVHCIDNAEERQKIADSVALSHPDQNS